MWQLLCIIPATEVDDNEEALNIIILASVIPSVVIIILCSIIMVSVQFSYVNHMQLSILFLDF